jgi:hypothetical protein
MSCPTIFCFAQAARDPDSRFAHAMLTQKSRRRDDSLARRAPSRKWKSALFEDERSVRSETLSAKSHSKPTAIAVTRV